MPPLVIEARGELVKSNFDDFAIAAREWIAGINLTLRTDEDFEQAAIDSKKAKETEDLLAETHRRTLENAVAVNAELEKLNGLSAEMRDVRLKLTKQIDNAKAEIRKSMIEGALAGIDCHKSVVETFRPLVENAIKGCKSLESMREKLRVAANIANDRIGRNRKALDDFEKQHGTAMTADRPRLEVEEHAALAPELERRRERAENEEKQRKLREEARRQVEEAKAKEKAAEMALALEREKAHGTTSLINAEQEKADDLFWLDEPKADASVIASKPEISEAEEWSQYESVLGEAFTKVRMFRGTMIHQSNREKAEAFAKGCGDLLAKIKKGGGK